MVHLGHKGPFGPLLRISEIRSRQQVLNVILDIWHKFESFRDCRLEFESSIENFYFDEICQK